LAEPAGLQEGLVIAGHGRHVWVETPSGRKVICHARGKKSQTVVGDQVLWLATQDEGTIEKVMPRRNLMYRQDEIRTKSFAANIDQVVIVLGAEPEFSDGQLSRALIAAAAQQLDALIVLNKRDLGNLFAAAWERLAPYRAMQYPVLATAFKPSTDTPVPQTADDDTERMRTLLTSKTSLVLGPSGAGKSSLINRWVPQANVLTREISIALQAGKHTTTSTTWYWLDADKQSALIDSPGFQEFGLHHIAPMDLGKLMPDIQAHASDCKFYNCSHLHEPGCGVRNACAAEPSPISPVRYKIYKDLFEELSQKRY
jgi:ribosome biogenesis GTPase